MGAPRSNIGRGPVRAKNDAAASGAPGVTTPATTTEGADAAPVTPTAPDPRVAELEAQAAKDAETIAALRAELDRANVAATEAGAERDALNRRIDALRDGADRERIAFKREWDAREQEFATKLDAARRAAPTSPRRAVADSRLRIGGAKLVPGDAIPEGTDLATLPAGSWRYQTEG